MQIPTFKDQLQLVDLGLARVSKNENLWTFKYKSDVMYKNKWKESEFLMECRGHTYDATTGELKVLPFRKSFNYGENGWWEDVDLNTPVVMYKKYNGFMAAVSDGIVSTTGTTNSEFVSMAKEYIPITNVSHLTFLYEVSHPLDYHIVEEDIGAKCLGYRSHHYGNFYPVGDHITCTLKQALDIAKYDRGEGYMLYMADNSTLGINTEYFCKVKSDRYRARKALIRMSDTKAKILFSSTSSSREFVAKNNLPHLFRTYAYLVDASFIAEEWIALTAKQRFDILTELEQRRGF